MTGTSVDSPFMISVCRSAALRRDHDRKNDEKQCYVRRRIGRSFEHDGSPAMEILNLFTGFAAIH